MEKREFGSTGLRVGVLGLGAAEIGFQGTDQHTVDTLILAARDYGINVVDTAAMYAESEEKIGRALAGRRDDFLVFTKCGRCLPPRSNLTGFQLRVERKLRASVGLADDYESLDWRPSALRWNIEQSLHRLKTDRIDLILLHSCTEETLRHGEVIEVLQRAKESGKVRHIGYSGDGAAACYAVRCGCFEALEVSVNIADQGAIEEVIPLAREYGMGIVAKRPITNRLWKSSRRPEASEHQPYWDRLQVLQYNFLKTERDIADALLFTLKVPGVDTAIVGTTSPNHLAQNAANVEAKEMTDNEFTAIRSRWKSIAQQDWIGQT